MSLLCLALRLAHNFLYPPQNASITLQQAGTKIEEDEVETGRQIRLMKAIMAGCGCQE